MLKDQQLQRIKKDILKPYFKDLFIELYLHDVFNFRDD